MGAPGARAPSCTEKKTVVLLKQFILLSKKLAAVYSQHVGAALGVTDPAILCLPVRNGHFRPGKKGLSRPLGLSHGLSSHIHVFLASLMSGHWDSGHLSGRVKQFARYNGAL